MGTENILFDSGMVVEGVPFKSKKKNTDREDTVYLEFFNQVMFHQIVLCGSLNLHFLTFSLPFLLR